MVSEPREEGGRIGVSARNRVMKLQKRASRDITPRAKKPQDSEEEAADTISRSRGSLSSRGSSHSVNDRRSGTQLSPPKLESEPIRKEEPLPKTRRKSTGTIGGHDTMDMMPFELVKRQIRPMTVPLVSQCVDLPICASTENELIVNKLEALEARKAPDRQWAKITKYAAYAARGFGAFTPTVGLSVFGLELQKAIRRQSNSLKSTL